MLNPYIDSPIETYLVHLQAWDGSWLKFNTISQMDFKKKKYNHVNESNICDVVGKKKKTSNITGFHWKLASRESEQYKYGEARRSPSEAAHHTTLTCHHTWMQMWTHVRIRWEAIFSFSPF